ncbi:hypothetical protein T484DRAFT_1876742 [Baffinella frigidus]|nr:hypothetical protein T484DRAFT_1876742 [Cryptophyta sp. CCMP2293]
MGERLGHLDPNADPGSDGLGGGFAQEGRAVDGAGFGLGMKVEVVFEDGEWYKGTIAERRSGGVWHVVFEDGDEADVQEGSQDMRVFGAASRPSAKRFATGSTTPPLRGAHDDCNTREAESEGEEREEEGDGEWGIDAPVTEFEAVQKIADGMLRRVDESGQPPTLEDVEAFMTGPDAQLELRKAEQRGKLLFPPADNHTDTSSPSASDASRPVASGGGAVGQGAAARPGRVPPGGIGGEQMVRGDGERSKDGGKRARRSSVGGGGRGGAMEWGEELRQEALAEGVHLPPDDADDATVAAFIQSLSA